MLRSAAETLCQERHRVGGFDCPCVLRQGRQRGNDETRPDADRDSGIHIRVCRQLHVSTGCESSAGGQQG